jgi:multidrug transporter EmrE-like cation transporter
MVIVGMSWCLVGLVMGDAPKKNVDTGLVQFWGAVVSTVASLVILFFTGSSSGEVSQKWLLITLILYFSSGFLNFFMLQLMSKAMQSGPNGIIWSIIQSAMIFPFIVGMIFYNTGAGRMKIIGVILLLAALIGFGMAKDNSSKGGNAWRWLSLLALLICAMQQNLATLPTYYPECRKVGSVFCTMASSAGLVAASVIFTLCTLTEEKRRQIKESFGHWNLWKYVIVLQGFSLITSYLLFYPGMFVMGREGLGMLCYPMMVGSCIVSFTLSSIWLLKEKMKPVQLAALIACIGGLILICTK